MLMATLQICLVSRSDGAEVGCWPWWASALPIAAVLLLLYLLLFRKDVT